MDLAVTRLSRGLLVSSTLRVPYSLKLVLAVSLSGLQYVTLVEFNVPLGLCIANIFAELNLAVRKKITKTAKSPNFTISLAKVSGYTLYFANGASKSA